MAKNDKKKMQAKVDEQTKLAQQSQNTLTNTLAPQHEQFKSNYNTAVPEAQNDYRSIMDQYKNFVASPAAQRYDYEKVDYNRSPELDSAMRGYQGFADNGGFDENALRDMRARGISPIRAVYANSMNEMQRQKNLSGGYSPNFNAAAAKMRSGTSQQIADQTQNVNADIAKMVQSGRLAGLGGLGGLSVSDMEMSQRAKLANQSAGLNAANLNSQNIDPMRLAAIQGQQQLFGTTPGMASMFGNQVLQSGNQMLGLGQNQLGIGNMTLGGQQQVAALPSNFQVVAGRIKKGAELAGRGIAAVGTGGASELGLAAARGGKFEL